MRGSAASWRALRASRSAANGSQELKERRTNPSSHPPLSVFERTSTCTQPAPFMQPMYVIVEKLTHPYACVEPPEDLRKRFAMRERGLRGRALRCCAALLCFTMPCFANLICFALLCFALPGATRFELL